jgi:hypothetical protein
MSATKLEHRVDRGKKALSLARQKGLDTTPWEKELAKLEQLQKQADEDYRLTIHLLATQGWCLWQCSILNDEIIALVRDEFVTGIPEGYVIYTKAEMEEAGRSNLSPRTLRLIHEVKRHSAATVVSVIARRSRGNLGGGTCIREALTSPSP